MPKHIVRLLVLMVLFGTGAYAAKQYFTVDSYYNYGHYRGDSVAQMASQKPKILGTAFCAQCHVKQSTAWDGGAHHNPAKGKAVQCVVCHGPAGARDPVGPYAIASTGPTHPVGVRMTIPADTARLCTVCHERIAGRPAQQPQINIADHAGTLQCVTCHDPHSPRTIAGSLTADAVPGNAGAGQALAAACAGCHAAPYKMAPNLSGQNAAYLAGAIAAYKAGTRDNPIMRAMVQSLNDASIRDIAAFFASQTCLPAQDELAGAADKQAAAAANCTVCHGVNGVARQPGWPNLRGQTSDYLAAALKSYRDGGHKNPLMSAATKDLRDADLTTLAAYFAGVGCK